MLFERMGMNGAQPAFAHRPPGSKYHLMTKATELAQLEAPYRDDITGFDNPFARWIAAANPMAVGEILDAYERDEQTMKDVAAKMLDFIEQLPMDRQQRELLATLRKDLAERFNTV